MFSMRCGFKSRTVVLAAAVASMLCGFSTAYLPAAEPAGLSFEERLAGHRAIEKVYWQHRIWPKGNPGPKPAFETMMPEEELRRKALEGQRLSAALSAFWQRPITVEDLQGEIDRMVRSTTWPSMLEELFGALGGDPVLVAECLARPLLVERLARGLYASDTRIHGDLVRRVRQELDDLGAVDDMPRLSGQYSEMEWARYGVGKSRREVMAEDGAGSRLILDPGAWQRLVNDLEADLGGARIGEVSPLNETADSFSVTALLERSEDRLRVATVVWPKRDFRSWWAEHRRGFEPDVGSKVVGLSLPAIAAKGVRMNTWTDTNTFGAPSERAYHTATWTGNEMVVWGGTDGQGVFYNGSRYYPGSDAWVPVNSVGRIDSRAYHSAVWTGTEIVFWGGWYGGSNYRGDGGRYRPGDDAWYTVWSAGSPSARREHSANWTGTYMVIFGGWDGDYVGLGGRWGGSNFWYTMTASDAPSARIGHVAVHCEDTYGPVVIWGGENSGGVLGDGREYDAIANTWETMPSTSLSPRTGHSGVYMGSYFPSSFYKGQRRVVIWGGNTGSTTTTTGAGYDPITNQWSNVQTTTTESRQGHTAIASDWRMIVWGGFSGGTLYNSGGIYNPVNNVWEPTFTIGAPTPRSGHTAVWRPEPGTSDLDGQMIVWGGEDATDYCDTGGSYSPWWDMLVAVSPDEFDAVPGGSEYAAITARLYSLSGYNGTVTLSCDPSYQVDCTFEQNPVTLAPNTLTLVDIDVHPDPNLVMTDYTILIGATHDDPRGYQVKMKMQDFDVTCAQSTVSVPPGGSVDVECTVGSDRGFDDPVSLSCGLPYTDCTFSPSSVTPPPSGTATTTLTIEPVFSSGSWSQDVIARSHGTNRYFDIDVDVLEGLIFSDGFNSGNTSAWSATVD